MSDNVILTDEQAVRVLAHIRVALDLSNEGQTEIDRLDAYVAALQARVAALEEALEKIDEVAVNSLQGYDREHRWGSHMRSIRQLVDSASQQPDGEEA